MVELPAVRELLDAMKATRPVEENYTNEDAAPKARVGHAVHHLELKQPEFPQVPSPHPLSRSVGHECQTTNCAPSSTTQHSVCVEHEQPMLWCTALTSSPETRVERTMQHLESTQMSPQVPSQPSPPECAERTIQITRCPLFMTPSQHRKQGKSPHKTIAAALIDKNGEQRILYPQPCRSQGGISKATSPPSDACINLNPLRQLASGAMMMVDPRRNHSMMGTIEPTTVEQTITRRRTTATGAFVCVTQPHKVGRHRS